MEKATLAGIPLNSRSVDISHLPRSVQEFIEEKAKICTPDSIYICDGSEEEYKELLKTLKESGWIQPLEKMQNWYENTIELN
jgi:GTP-dependent phosphoenolpyruvate carboxykinase